MKIVKVILFNGHKFRIRGNDHMEGLQYFLDKELGKGEVYLYNKRGGTMYVMFIGDPSDKEAEELINKVEQICNLEYIETIVEKYLASYEQNLRDKFGDKIVVAECL